MSFTYQYWRLNISGTDSSSAAVDIAEWKFYDSGSAQIGLIQNSRSAWSLTVDSAASGFPASNLIDGNASTIWSSSGGSTGFIIIDAGSAQTFDTIQLQTRPSSNQGSPNSFSVFVSDDGSTWGSAIASFTGSSNSSNLLSAYSLGGTYTHRYVKITIASVYSGPSNIVLAEVYTGATNGAAITAASDSNGTTGSFAPSFAFDNNAATFWNASGVPTAASPQWIRAQFASAVTVVSFSVQARNDASCGQTPTCFILQGSSDGSIWTTIGDYCATSWSAGQVQTFTAGNFGLGVAYRLRITANGSGGVSLSEWKLYDGGGTQISTPVGSSGASSSGGASAASESATSSTNGFDGNSSTFWASSNAPSTGSPQWLAYFFSDSSITLGSFSITDRSGNTSQAPTTFSLQKSTDNGATWTTLQSYTDTWSSDGTHTFTVSGGGSSITFRRTRSALGTRAGSRQRTH